MKKDEDDRIHLDANEAIGLLANGARVHTFIQAGPALIGADWDREDALKEIAQHGAQLGGDRCVEMGHGLVIVRQGESTVFVAHDTEALERIREIEKAL